MPQFIKKDPSDTNRKKGKNKKNEPYNSKFVRQKEALQEKRASIGDKVKKENRKKDIKLKQIP